MDIGKHVGNRIREIRKSKGLSQEELAFKASLNASHFSKIERGEKSATLESLEKIIGALEISFSDFFTDIYSEKSEIKDKTIIDKINSKVSTLTPKDQMAIYRLIKVAIWWKRK